jgi:hypothetical protein
MCVGGNDWKQVVAQARAPQKAGIAAKAKILLQK